MNGFQAQTKNNGLKNVEFGSEEYVKRTQSAEARKKEEEAMEEYYSFVTSVQAVHGR